MAIQITIVTSLLVVLAVGSANSARIVRQASVCKAGIQCVPINDCPPIQALLNNPSRQNLIKVREAICGSNRRNIKVCCDSSSEVTTPVTTPSITTPTTPRTPPTDPTTTPGEGERLLPANCGKASSTDRIYNGENVTLGAYPWMAILGYTGDNGEVVWGCGGALINNRYIVTAAHCVTPDLPIVEVRLGEHDLNTNPDCLPGSSTCSRYQSFRVTRTQIISHVSYDTRTPYSDDIALIRLDRPATFNNFVHPICIPESNFDVRSFLNSRQAIVAGWGRTETGSKSKILKRVRVPMVDINQCQPIYLNQLLPEQARNAEKAMTTLARWRAAQEGGGQQQRTRRPFLASECEDLREAEKWRNQVISEIARKVSQIQNAGLGEFRIRDLNDEINKLLREKGHWETRIKELGGPDYARVGPRMTDMDGQEAPGNRGYMYFGAAKDLPGVRELFEQEPPPPPRKTRGELMKDIDADYYGYRDDDDGVLIPLEKKAEKKAIKDAVKLYTSKKLESMAEGENGEQIREVVDEEEEEEEDDDEDSQIMLDETDERSEVQRFMAHVPNIPTQADIEAALVERKKNELLKTFLGE